MNPALRYSFIYGGLAAVVLAMFIAVIGLLQDRVAWVATMTFGLSVMLVAMSFVFVGMKRYRDVESGGVIRFRRALGVGLLIALIAAIAYVLMWEVYLALTFMAIGVAMVMGWVFLDLPLGPGAQVYYTAPVAVGR